jgi:hypothetical protein
MWQLEVCVISMLSYDYYSNEIDNMGFNETVPQFLDLDKKAIAKMLHITSISRSAILHDIGYMVA